MINLSYTCNQLGIKRHTVAFNFSTSSVKACTTYSKVVANMCLFVLFTLVFVIWNAEANVEFEILNKESGPVWVGIQGNPGHPHLNGGGFILDSGRTVTVSAPDNWAGRFWPRTWCDYNSKHCLTGDCGNKIECNGAGGNPPATLLEITLKGAGGLDYYDISLVDGFNIRAFIEPVGAASSGQYSCTRAGCLADVNWNCPNELRIWNAGQTIACESACLKFNTDQYCCRNNFGTPETCKSSTWPVNYPAYFKGQCPDAYSYAYDDHKSTFTCKASRYRIQFGV